MGAPVDPPVAALGGGMSIALACSTPWKTLCSKVTPTVVSHTALQRPVGSNFDRDFRGAISPFQATCVPQMCRPLGVSSIGEFMKLWGKLEKMSSSQSGTVAQLGRSVS